MLEGDVLRSLEYGSVTVTGASARQEATEVYNVTVASPASCTNTARLAEQIQQEGSELPVRETSDGRIETFTGDGVPDELVPGEAGERDSLIEVGLGAILGYAFAFRARFLATLSPGLVFGVDLDVKPGLLSYSEGSASVILGWSFDVGTHVIRPHVSAVVGQRWKGMLDRLNRPGFSGEVEV